MNLLDNLNRAPNYEFSLGNKNDIEQNFNPNSDLNNININNSEEFSIKPNESVQQKFYFNDTNENKNFINNTNNSLNNEYLKRENLLAEGNQNYNNINTNKQSKIFFKD